MECCCSVVVAVLRRVLCCSRTYTCLEVWYLSFEDQWESLSQRVNTRCNPGCLEEGLSSMLNTSTFRKGGVDVHVEVYPLHSISCCLRQAERRCQEWAAWLHMSSTSSSLQTLPAGTSILKKTWSRRTQCLLENPACFIMSLTALLTGSDPSRRPWGSIRPDCFTVQLHRKLIS